MQFQRISSDITTALAVESVFSPNSLHDPWGDQLFGAFADLYVFCHSIEFPVPVTESGAELEMPRFLKLLSSRDSQTIACKEVIASSLARPNEDFNYIESAKLLKEWLSVPSGQNYMQARGWIDFQRQEVAASHEKRTGTREGILATFLMSEYKSDIEQIAKSVNLSNSNFIYLLDVIVRGAVYANIVGQDRFYFAHPLRTEVPTVFSSSTPGTLSPLNVGGFAKVISRMRPHLSLEEYCICLYELRAAVMLSNFTSIPIEDKKQRFSTLKEIASHLKLPPTLSSKFSDAVAKLPAVLGAAIGTQLPSALASTAAGAAVGAWLGNIYSEEIHYELEKFIVEASKRPLVNRILRILRIIDYEIT